MPSLRLSPVPWAQRLRSCRRHSSTGLPLGLVKKLLHRRCVHSLTVQHSKDGERALLRAFLHVPHDDIEVCSCNGTPTAARVAAAAAAAAATNHRPAGGGRSGANPDGTGSETAAAGGSTAGAGEAQDSGSGDGGVAAAELAAPGTCGPPERSTHVVEVLLDTEHWALQSCSSSCCGVGYDVLHSQLCPAVAAVVLAARMGSGAEVLCEHDLGSLTAAAAAVDRRSPAPPAGTEAGPGSATGGPEAAAGRSGAAAAGGGEQLSSCAWAPPELGLGPPPVARVLAAVSGGALVLGPNYVDPPAPLAASTLPGSGLPLGLQRELDCPRTIPTDIRLHLIPCCRPPASAAAAAAGPSTSTARPPPVSEPPPVPPPHIPALPAAEPGSRVNPRFAGGSFPSAAARFAFSGWYREAAPVVVANEKHRDTYRMLLPPGEEDPQPAAGAGAGPREGAGGADGGAWGPPAARPQPPPRPVQLPPPSWSFGSAGGQVSLELSGESADRFIAARAAERGPLWEMRMAFLTSHATLELDPELRLHTNTSDTPDAWPPVVLAAFDEACCPIGQPAGSHGPAGALCGLMRVMWLCLHVWEVDSGVARRAKIVAQAIAKLLLVSELPAPLRASSARLLGGWRLKLGDMAAHSRRTAYASTTDAALTDLLARLTTAYLVARDGWDAPHLLTAMGITPAPSAGPALAAADNAAAGRDRGSGGGGGCAQAAALVPAGGRWGSHQQQQQQQGSQQGEATQPPSSAGAAGVGVVAGKGASAAAAAAPARPELQPSWLGFRPAHQAAMRRLQQQQQQQQAGAGPGVGPVVMIMGPGGMMDPYGAQLSSTPPVMPFVPYAPPPLQGLVNMATPGLQEVTERLHWLGHIGLDGPYVALAAVSGEPDVERACRLAVERLSSAAAKAQQACFLLYQVLGPPPQQQQQLKAGGADTGADAAVAAPGAAAAAAAAGGSAAIGALRLGSAAAAGGGGGGGAGSAAGGVDSLVVSAVAQLPPTFVAGCAGRMFMSAVRTALSIRTNNGSNAAFELSFLRATNAVPGGGPVHHDPTSPAEALLAAIDPAAGGGGAGGTRPSPYTALLRSVIAMVAENQDREARAEEEALRELGLLDEQMDEQGAAADGGSEGSGGGGAGGASGSSGNGGPAAAAPGDAAAGVAAADMAARRPMEYTLAAMMQHQAMGRGAMVARREEHCDCEACRRERQHRLAQLASEMPPGSALFARLRPEDACFVSDAAALTAFTRASGPSGEVPQQSVYRRPVLEQPGGARHRRRCAVAERVSRASSCCQ
ncbi:hypothetical protein PLESTB_000073900 [Pleodorina starrii]|uniref:Uncharacterized protein n=1 Tax=Pleodorina starrii TaxID=330485 RepID=A0A9W6EX19_9CHLO|nr:hypothetical protein PLESTB_000073900 [Pleodorina starrii]